MSLQTRQKLALLVAVGGVGIAAVDRLTVPSSVEAGEVAVSTQAVASAAPPESLAEVFRGLPDAGDSASRFAWVFRDRGSSEAAASAPVDRSAGVDAPGPSSLAMPVVSAVTSANGGVAVIDGRVLRVGEISDGVTLLDVSGMTATVQIRGRIEVLSVR